MNFVRTARRGPRPVATREQVERVLELDAAGVSLRAIALDVFGDAELFGRVHRLLRSTRRKSERELANDLEVAQLLDELLRVDVPPVE